MGPDNIHPRVWRKELAAELSELYPYTVYIFFFLFILFYILFFCKTLRVIYILLYNALYKYCKYNINISYG